MGWNSLMMEHSSTASAVERNTERPRLKYDMLILRSILHVIGKNISVHITMEKKTT